ncbi:hypothetical protein HDV57DRAFT_466103 [Trichoderma longibrachiatum]
MPSQLGAGSRVVERRDEERQGVGKPRVQRSSSTRHEKLMAQVQKYDVVLESQPSLGPQTVFSFLTFVDPSGIEIVGRCDAPMTTWIALENDGAPPPAQVLLRSRVSPFTHPRALLISLAKSQQTERRDPRSASRRSSQVVPGSSREGGISDAGRLLGALQRFPFALVHERRANENATTCYHLLILLLLRGKQTACSRANNVLLCEAGLWLGMRPPWLMHLARTDSHRNEALCFPPLQARETKPTMKPTLAQSGSKQHGRKDHVRCPRVFLRYGTSTSIRLLRNCNPEAGKRKRKKLASGTRDAWRSLLTKSQAILVRHRLLSVAAHLCQRR